MTQVQLGLKLNAAQETISVYEIGRITPPADMLVKLADTLSTTVDYLLGRTESISLLTLKPLSEDEDKLLYDFRQLSAMEQARLMGFIEALKQ